LVLACATLVWRRGDAHGQALPSGRTGKRTSMLANAGRQEDVNGCYLSARQVVQWIVLAFITSSWLVGVTAYISTDLAPIPLLWTVPLGIYLLTYILAFAPASGRWIRAAAALFPLLVVPLVMVLSTGFTHLFWIPLHLLAFFVGALLCHGKLAAARPESEQATSLLSCDRLGRGFGRSLQCACGSVGFRPFD
jgi:hypothetical protein